MSCNKQKKVDQTIMDPESFEAAPYDTVAVDSFSAGATSAIQREIARAKAAKIADSLHKIKVEEDKKKNAEKEAEEREKQEKEKSEGKDKVSDKTKN